MRFRASSGTGPVLKFTRKKYKSKVRIGYPVSSAFGCLIYLLPFLIVLLFGTLLYKCSGNVPYHPH